MNRYIVVRNGDISWVAEPSPDGRDDHYVVVAECRSDSAAARIIKALNSRE